MQGLLSSGSNDNSPPPDHSPTVENHDNSSRPSTTECQRSEERRVPPLDRSNAQARSRTPQIYRRSIGPALRASPRLPRDVGWKSRLPRRVGELLELFDTSSSARTRRGTDQRLPSNMGNGTSLIQASLVHLRFPSEHGQRMFQDLVTKIESGTEHDIDCGKSGCDSHDACLKVIAGEYTSTMCDEPAVYGSRMQERAMCTSTEIFHVTQEPRILNHPPGPPAPNGNVQEIRADSLMSVYQLSTVASLEACASTIPKADARRVVPLINPRPQEVRLQDIKQHISLLAQVFPGQTPPDKYPYGHSMPELVIRSKTTPPETNAGPRRESTRRYSYSASSTAPGRSNVNAAQDGDGTQGSSRDRTDDLISPNTSKVIRQAKRRKRRASTDPDEVDDQDIAPKSETEHVKVTQGFRCVHYACGCPEKHRGHRGCETSHEYIAGIARHHGKPHRFFYCTRCFSVFQNEQDKKEHIGCTQKCVTSECPNYGNDFCNAGTNLVDIRPCSHGKPNYPNSATEQWKELFRMAHNRQEPSDISPPTTTVTRRQGPLRTCYDTSCMTTELLFRIAELEELLLTLWTYLDNLDNPNATNISWKTIFTEYQDHLKSLNELSPSKTDICSCQSESTYKVAKLENLVEKIWKMIDGQSPSTPGDKAVYRMKVERFLGRRQLDIVIASSSRVFAPAGIAAMGTRSQVHDTNVSNQHAYGAPDQSVIRHPGADGLGTSPYNAAFRSFIDSSSYYGDDTQPSFVEGSTVNDYPTSQLPCEVPVSQQETQSGPTGVPPAYGPQYGDMEPAWSEDLGPDLDFEPNKDRKGKGRDSAYESAPSAGNKQ